METRGKKDGTLGEEVSAFGQRAKGAAKDAFGDVIGDEAMEAEGERENVAGRARQAANDVTGGRSVTMVPACRKPLGACRSLRTSSWAFSRPCPTSRIWMPINPGRVPGLSRL